MSRKLSKKITNGSLVIAGLSIGPAIPVFAGTVLIQPDAAASDAVENSPSQEYPDSRFGYAPMRGRTGTEAGESDRYKGEGASRSPAGLVFDADSKKNYRTAPTTVANTEPAPVRKAAETSTTGGSAAAPAAPQSPQSPMNLSAPSDVASTAARLGVQEVAVIASDLGFFPKTIFVSRDVPVRLFVTGASKNTLCLMMDSFEVRRQVRSQKIEEISFTPNTPGRYRFYCPVNGMEGTLIVKEFASAGSP